MNNKPFTVNDKWNIEDLKVWNYALSPAAINALFAGCHDQFVTLTDAGFTNNQAWAIISITLTKKKKVKAMSSKSVRVYHLKQETDESGNSVTMTTCPLPAYIVLADDYYQDIKALEDLVDQKDATIKVTLETIKKQATTIDRQRDEIGMLFRNIHVEYDGVTHTEEK